MRHTLRAIDEPLPGTAWRRLFDRFWPAYERWCLTGGVAARPDLATAQRHLALHMPELLPTWQRLAELAGGSERVARFLTLYRPAPYISGCSQAAWVNGEPVLVRNYDYSPRLWEATLLRTSWHGRQVLALGDCLWGALDGVNDSGLAVALAFGGRRVVGDGFGIPLVLRYVLEFCRDARDAEEALRRVPSHMAYNVTVLDARGDFFTAFLAPDRPPVVRRWPIATNHQETRDWQEHTRATASLEREARLAHLFADPLTTAESLCRSFLEPPLFSRRYARRSGTLYTAIYRPAARALELRWPGVPPVHASIEDFASFELPRRFKGAAVPPTLPAA